MGNTMAPLERVPVVPACPIRHSLPVPISGQELADPGAHSTPFHDLQVTPLALQMFCTTPPDAGPRYVEGVWPQMWPSLFLS